MKKLLHLITAITICSLSHHAIACWDEAANRYGVNPYLLYAIAKTESGLNPLAINRNKDGTYDVGLMQINSRWFPVLQKYGFNKEHLWNPCVSINIGAWILSQNMQRLGNSWNAVGAYNSSNANRRAQYALKVYKNIPPEVLATQ